MKELKQETPSPILYYKQQGVDDPNLPVLATEL